MDFEKICMMFTMQEPYYGIILSSMERVPMSGSRIQTMAVTKNGNVFRLIYNPDFVATLDVSTTLELLKHEICHLCFNHFTLFQTPPSSPDEQHVRNLAADLEVNSYLNKSNIHGIEVYFPEQFNWDKGLGTKEYYRLLLEMAQQQQEQQASQQVQKPCNGGCGGQSDDSNKDQDNSDSNKNQNSSGTPNINQNNQTDTGEEEEEDSVPGGALSDMKELDDHSMWPDEEEQETVNQIIEDMLIAAAEEVEKSGRGTLPAEMVGTIEGIRTRRKPKPVADWKRYVRRYLGNEFSEFIRKSKKRESRRFPDAAGNRHRRKSNILVAVDTSGSVSMPEYLEFFGQIRTLTPTASFDVVECDADIQYTYHFKNFPNQKIHGGGGTDFAPVIDMFLANRKKYDALIYFTDGECYVPDNTPKETLWVISSRGDKSRAKEFRVNGASVVFIPKKD